MKVHFICGYYSDLAHKNIARRPEDYWDAYFFTWAVKVGQFKRSFYIHSARGKIHVTEKNFDVARKMFGGFVAERVASEWPDEKPLLVSVPSKDGLINADRFRSSDMLKEAMAETKLSGSTADVLRWSESLNRAHQGGARGRDVLKPYLWVSPEVHGHAVVLIDDLLSTGGSLLAAKERMEETGARVIGAVTCGRTIYDFKTRPFGRQQFDLKAEIADFRGSASH